MGLLGQRVGYKADLVKHNMVSDAWHQACCFLSDVQEIILEAKLALARTPRGKIAGTTEGFLRKCLLQGS